MIVSKTPLRVSFFGGGSDLPHYYEKNDGLCVSTSIDQYIMIAANRCATPHIKLMYSEIEVVKNLKDLKHDRARCALQRMGVDDNIEIASFANIPTKGTGLGSSSSFTVGLLHALKVLEGNSGTSPFDLAEDACDVEINMCEEPIGKQDQYAAAYGGFNAYAFSEYGVAIRPIHITSDKKWRLNQSLMFFSTKNTRSASSILQEQVNNNKVDITSQLVDIAQQSLKVFEHGDLNDIGYMLDTSWKLKQKQAQGITSEWIDTIYDEGIKAGALGGKLLGAGGGGYVMFYVPLRRQQKVRDAMIRLGCPELIANMTDRGSTVQTIS